jgi:hypothetical protein
LGKDNQDSDIHFYALRSIKNRPCQVKYKIIQEIANLAIKVNEIKFSIATEQNSIQQIKGIDTQDG